jgi:hypothetical protein
VLARVDTSRAPAARVRLARADALRARAEVLAIETVTLESTSTLLPR